MKNNKTLFLLLCLLITPVFLQKAELITQQINVENAVRTKVERTVDKFLNQSQYIVIVNARLDLKPLSIESVGDKTQRGINSPTPGYEYIPGIPTRQSILQPSSNSENFQYSTDKYFLYGLEITIYIDETISTGSLQQNIKTLVLKNIPEIADCSDCVLFETIDFLTQNKQSNRYEELLANIELLEQERRDAEQDLQNWRFDQLEVQLSASEDARSEWENQARNRENLRRLDDSTRMASLQNIEKEYRERQDSLYVLTSIKLDEALRGRIESEANTKRELLGLIKMQIQGEEISNDNISDATRSDLYTKRPTMVNNSFSGQIWLMIAAVVILLIILFILLSKNKTPVYLKPKTSGGAIPVEESTLSPPTTRESFPQTSANENEEVQRSELQSLRQSAVSMSVSEKGGANEIVQDWLNDGSEKKEPEDERNDDATNENKE